MRKKGILGALIIMTGAALIATAQVPKHGPQTGAFGRGTGRGARMTRCQGPGAMPGGPGLMLLIKHPALARKLGLTADEVYKLRNLVFDHAQQMIELRATAERARLELEKAMSADQPDVKAVEKAIDEVHQIEAQIEKTKYRHQQAVLSVISAERLEELWESSRALRTKRWQTRRGDRADQQGRAWQQQRSFGRRCAGIVTPKGTPPAGVDDEIEDNDDMRLPMAP